LYQVFINCEEEEKKPAVLDELYIYVTIGQTIIFAQTRNKVKELKDYLTEKGHEVCTLTGGDDIETRDRIIDDFRAGNKRVLITTNVLSRGVDVLQVSLVINYDVPETKFGAPDFETYLHRIGRSARYGKSGLAINLVHNERSLGQLQQISDHFRKKIDEIPLGKLDQLEKILEELGRDYKSM